MKTNLFVKLFVMGCLLFAFLTGCATTAPETPTIPTATLVPPTATLVPPTVTPVPPTNTPEPTSCEEVEGNCLKLSFDGENCIYEGPSEMKTGPITLLFFNESEKKTLASIASHTGDESIQDMSDYHGEGPSEKFHPYWARQVHIKGAPAGESYIWEDFLEANVYTLFCGQYDPLLLWFGGGVKVED